MPPFRPRPGLCSLLTPPFDQRLSQVIALFADYAEHAMRRVTLRPSQWAALEIEELAYDALRTRLAASPLVLGVVRTSDFVSSLCAPLVGSVPSASECELRWLTDDPSADAAHPSAATHLWAASQLLRFLEKAREQRADAANRGARREMMHAALVAAELEPWVCLPPTSAVYASSHAASTNKSGGGEGRGKGDGDGGEGHGGKGDGEGDGEGSSAAARLIWNHIFRYAAHLRTVSWTAELPVVGLQSLNPSSEPEMVHTGKASESRLDRKRKVRVPPCASGRALRFRSSSLAAHECSTPVGFAWEGGAGGGDRELGGGVRWTATAAPPVANETTLGETLRGRTVDLTKAKGACEHGHLFNNPTQQGLVLRWHLFDQRQATQLASRGGGRGRAAGRLGEMSACATDENSTVAWLTMWCASSARAVLIL